MSLPTISVLIPCYKQAIFLAEAIESALAQTAGDAEIIVVDDGSPDHTEEVARRYPDVRYIRQENRGLSGARNRAVAASHGEYIVFLDADDRLCPEHFALSLAAFEERPDASMVCGNYRWFGASDTWHIHDCTPRPDHYASLLRGTWNIPVHTSLIWRPAILQLGGFDESLPACEDLDFFLRLTRKFTVHCHHRLVAEYRRHSGQMTRRPELIFRGFHQTIRKQQDLIDGMPAYREALIAGWAHMRRNWGDPVFWDLLDAVRHGGVRRMARDLSIILQYYPGALLEHVRRKLGRAAAPTS